MSGGTFDGAQYQFDYAVEKIEEVLKNNGLTVAEHWNSLTEDEQHDAGEYVKPWDALHHPCWIDDTAAEFANNKLGLLEGDWEKISDVSKAKWHELKRKKLKDLIDEHNNSAFDTSYSDKTASLIREMLPTIKKARIYLQRIDWLFSGDDGESAFAKRTKEDLEKDRLDAPELKSLDDVLASITDEQRP